MKQEKSGAQCCLRCGHLHREKTTWENGKMINYEEDGEKFIELTKPHWFGHDIKCPKCGKKQSYIKSKTKAKRLLS